MSDNKALSTSGDSSGFHPVAVSSRVPSMTQPSPQRSSSGSLQKQGSMYWSDSALPGATEGCVVLGKTADGGNKYNTRYRIDHKRQHKNMTADVVKESCVPCVLEESRENWRVFLWSIVSSEAFLLSLHILALALGVSKEALRIRDVDEELELIHSSVETSAACLQISIRGISAYMEYRDIQEHVASVEELASTHSARGDSLRRYVLSFCITCVVMVIVAISSMVAFKYLAHLGWTILSNNFVLIVGMVFASLVKERMDKVISVIREDQHKAVLYEASLLLKEAHGAFSSKAPGQYFYRINAFLKSLKDTDLFGQPEHIKIMDNYSSNLGMIATMDMQSMV